MENDKEERLSPLEEVIDIIEYNKSIEEAIKSLKLKCSLTPNPAEKRKIMDSISAIEEMDYYDFKRERAKLNKKEY